MKLNGLNILRFLLLPLGILLIFLTLNLAPVFALPSDDEGGFLPDGTSVGGTGGAREGDNNPLGIIDTTKLKVPTDVNEIIGSLIQLVYAVAGIVFFFMFLLGGIRYITAGGDEKAATSARATLTQAVIGLVIVVAAFLITQLLFSIFGISGFIKLG